MQLCFGFNVAFILTFMLKNDDVYGNIQLTNGYYIMLPVQRGNGKVLPSSEDRLLLHTMVDWYQSTK